MHPAFQILPQLHRETRTKVAHKNISQGCNKITKYNKGIKTITQLLQNIILEVYLLKYYLESHLIYK